MFYREFPPSRELSRYLRCLWVLRYSHDLNAEAERVIPDGCCEIIMNRAAPFQQVHADGTKQSQPSVMLVGQIDRFILIQPTGDVDLLGVRFQPGGLHALLGLNVQEVNHQRIALSSISARLSRRLTEATCGDLDANLDRVLRTLTTMLPKSERRRSLVERAVVELGASQGTLAISDLGRRLGVTPRQLERRFRHEAGLTPKRFARILRFNNLLRLCQNRPATWTEYSLACGYYDQAHLIRDFHDLAGMSPRAFHRSTHKLADCFSIGQCRSDFSNSTNRISAILADSLE